MSTSPKISTRSQYSHYRPCPSHSQNQNQWILLIIRLQPFNLTTLLQQRPRKRRIRTTTLKIQTRQTRIILQIRTRHRNTILQQRPRKTTKVGLSTSIHTTFLNFITLTLNTYNNTRANNNPNKPNKQPIPIIIIPTRHRP